MYKITWFSVRFLAAAGSLVIPEPPGDSNPFPTHCHNRPFGKLVCVIMEQTVHESDAPCCRHIGEPHKPGVRCVLGKDELPEILVHSHEDAPLRVSPFEKRPIPGISTSLARFDYVVPLVAQPICKSLPRAAIDQESHCT